MNPYKELLKKFFLFIPSIFLFNFQKVKILCLWTVFRIVKLFYVILLMIIHILSIFSALQVHHANSTFILVHSIHRPDNIISSKFF